MAENEQESGLTGILKEGVGALFRIISASIFPPIVHGTEMVMKTVEESVRRMESRIMRRMSTLLLIGFGGAVLLCSLFFLLRDSFGMSSAVASFIIGIAILMIGLLLKAGEPDR